MTENTTSMVGRAVNLTISDPWDLSSCSDEGLGGRIIRDGGDGSFSIRLDKALKLDGETFEVIEAFFRHTGTFNPKLICGKPAAFNFGTGRREDGKGLLFIGSLELSEDS